MMNYYAVETLVFAVVLSIILGILNYLKYQKVVKKRAVYEKEYAARIAAKEERKRREEEYKKSARVKFEVARLRRKLYDVKYITETNIDSETIFLDQYKDTDQEGYVHAESDVYMVYFSLLYTGEIEGFEGCGYLCVAEKKMGNVSIYKLITDGMYVKYVIQVHGYHSVNRFYRGYNEGYVAPKAADILCYLQRQQNYLRKGDDINIVFAR